MRRSLSLDLTPGALVAGRTALWVADFNANLVEQVDSSSGREIATVRAGNGPAALALAGGAVWVANSLDSTVSRIDARTGTVEATLAVGSSPSALAIGGGLGLGREQVLGRGVPHRPEREPRDGHGAGRRPSRRRSRTGLGRVWAGAAAGGAEHRGGTLRLVTPTPIPTIDPAHANLCRAGSVHAPGLRHAGHLRGLAGAGRAAARARPCSLDPGAERRRHDLHVPAAARDPLLRRSPVARRRLPARGRAAVPRPLDRGWATTGASRAQTPAWSGRVIFSSRRAFRPMFMGWSPQGESPLRQRSDRQGPSARRCCAWPPPRRAPTTSRRCSRWRPRRPARRSAPPRSR